MNINMDGRSRYAKVQKILKPIVGKTIHMDKLWRRIIIDIGGSDTVVRDVMKLMITLGLINEVKPFYYKILSHKADI